MTEVGIFLRRRWRGIALIALTYFYFLIFAQFGFLHRVTEDLGAQYWNLVLGLMGGAGLFGALWTACRFEARHASRWLQGSFLVAGLGALLAVLGHSVFVLAAAAAVSGFSLAVLTVSLVGCLQLQLPREGIGLVCGIGTGIAYFFSNVPAVFEATATQQCLLAAVAAVLGLGLALWGGSAPRIRGSLPVESDTLNGVGRSRLLGVVLLFIAQIWADSAAFTQIQESAQMRSASWSGAGQLWSLGCIHLISAVLGGWLMDLRALRSLSLFAMFGLMLGYLMLQAGQFGLVAALLYAAAVSVYSTALVAFALVQDWGRRPVFCAGVVFGLAGWLGSALGIGMVHDLGRIPLLFWPVAWCVILLGGRLIIRRAQA